MPRGKKKKSFRKSPPTKPLKASAVARTAKAVKAVKAVKAKPAAKGAKSRFIVVSASGETYGVAEISPTLREEAKGGRLKIIDSQRLLQMTNQGAWAVLNQLHYDQIPRKQGAAPKAQEAPLEPALTKIAPEEALPHEPAEPPRSQTAPWEMPPPPVNDAPPPPESESTQSMM